MKIKTNEVEQFIPIEITITIESENELETLWHRLNIPDAIVRENTEAINGKDIVLLKNITMFSTIDDIMKQRGLK